MFLDSAAGAFGPETDSTENEVGRLTKGLGWRVLKGRDIGLNSILLRVGLEFELLLRLRGCLGTARSIAPRNIVFSVPFLWPGLIV